MTVPAENLLMRLLPRPDISFVLDAPEQRILVDRPEHSGEFIRKEQILYRQVADHFSLSRISTSDSPSIVWNNMFSEIKVALGERASVEQIALQQVIS